MAAESVETRSDMTRSRRFGAAGWAGAIVVALLLLFLLGPRPTVDPVSLELVVPEAPEALNAWVADREAAFDDIVPGAEARILWADPDNPAPTDLAIVYLHGFSASNRETAPVTENVARALGINAYLTRLAGHGRDGAAMGEATAEDWLRNGVEAVAVGRALGERVILLGVSTGGTVASWAAARDAFKDDVAAMVLISPNFQIEDHEAWILTLPWGGLIARAMVGPERSFEPRNELQARYWTTRYPTRVLPEMASLVKEMTPDLFGQVEAPLLLFISPDDPVVEPRAGRAAFEAMGSAVKELETVAGDDRYSNHVLAGDILSPGRTDMVVERIVRFIEERIR